MVTQIERYSLTFDRLKDGYKQIESIDGYRDRQIFKNFRQIYRWINGLTWFYINIQHIFFLITILS